MERVRICDSAGRVVICDEEGRVEGCETPIDVGLWVVSTGYLPLPVVFECQHCGVHVRTAWCTGPNDTWEGWPKPRNVYAEHQDSWDFVRLTLPGPGLMARQYVYADGLTPAQVRAAWRNEIGAVRWYGPTGPLYQAGTVGGAIPLRWYRQANGAIVGRGSAKCVLAVNPIPDLIVPTAILDNYSASCCFPRTGGTPVDVPPKLLSTLAPWPCGEKYWPHIGAWNLDAWPGAFYDPSTPPPVSATPFLYNPDVAASISVSVTIPSGDILDLGDPATVVRARWRQQNIFQSGWALFGASRSNWVWIDYVRPGDVCEGVLRRPSEGEFGWGTPGHFNLQNPPEPWLTSSGWTAINEQSATECITDFVTNEPPNGLNTPNYTIEGTTIGPHYVQVYSE